MSQPSFGKSRFADMTSLIFPGRNLVFSASSWQPVLVPVMPIGVEHIQAAAETFESCDVLVPVMPIGVEHLIAAKSYAGGRSVLVPVMPIGVEHTDHPHDQTTTDERPRPRDANRR